MPFLSRGHLLWTFLVVTAEGWVPVASSAGAQSGFTIKNDQWSGCPDCCRHRALVPVAFYSWAGPVCSGSWAGLLLGLCQIADLGAGGLGRPEILHFQLSRAASGGALSFRMR